jgi:hypothetical protein
MDEQGEQNTGLSVVAYSPRTILSTHQRLQRACVQEANRAEQSHQELV